MKKIFGATVLILLLLLGNAKFAFVHSPREQLEIILEEICQVTAVFLTQDIPDCLIVPVAFPGNQ